MNGNSQTAQRDMDAYGNHHDGVDEDGFAAMREARDATLPVPRLLLPSIQINIRAGRFLETQGNGIPYLKIPVRMKQV